MCPCDSSPSPAVYAGLEVLHKTERATGGHKPAQEKAPPGQRAVRAVFSQSSRKDPWDDFPNCPLCDHLQGSPCPYWPADGMPPVGDNRLDARQIGRSADVDQNAKALRKRGRAKGCVAFRRGPDLAPRGAAKAATVTTRWDLMETAPHAPARTISIASGNLSDFVSPCVEARLEQASFALVVILRLR
jgi:hypothetical protein